MPLYPRAHGWSRYILAAASVGLSAAVLGGQSDKHREAGTTLIVGAPSDSFPYSFVDKNGLLTGFATDLTRAVAAEMRTDVRFEAHPSPELPDMLRSDRVDALQLFSKTPQRESFADFSVPFLRLQGALFIASNHRDEFNSPSDLQGKRLAVVGVGSTAIAFVRDKSLDMQIVYAPSPEAALREVQAGRCEATFLSRLTALSIIRENRLRGLEILGEPLDSYDVRHCFAVRAGDAELLARLNEALALVHSSGVYDQIYQHWFVGIDAPMFTRHQVVQWAAFVFGGFSLFACWALVRQHRLHRRLRLQSAEIVEQAEMLRALYQNIPVGILVFGSKDGTTRLVAMNDYARRLLETTAAGGVGQSIDQLPWKKAWLLQARRWTADWPNPGEAVHDEQLVESGRRIVLETVRVALETPATGEARLCVLIEDITDRKRTGEEVAQGRRLRAIGELVGGIAHEFNNLMTPLLLEASEVKAARHEDRELQASMDVMIEVTKRAAELTRRLLTFARRDESRTELVDIGAIVQNCTALIRPTLDRRITWNSTISPDLPPLPGNATDVQQVLLNLVINARDALDERLAADRPDGDPWAACLQITARHHAEASDPRGPVAPTGARGWIELVVEDNGTGMDPATVERIFEPFFTTKEVGRGTGLGLATAWSMVNKAGGEIRVESTKGVGTALHVWWPILPQSVSSSEGGPARRSGVAPRPRHVLVVDDEPALVRTVCSMLKRSGHTTEAIDSGTEAIARIKADGAPWDAVLLDLNLPGADGIAVARTLRGRGYAGRIILMSGRITDDEPASNDLPRIDGRLPKPFLPRDLDSALGL